MFFGRMYRAGLYFDKPNDNPEGDPNKDKDPEGDEVKLTAEQQAHVDKIIGNTRKQAREGAIAGLLKDLGLDKVDDLKTILKKAKDAEDATKTETERLKQQADEATKRATDAETAKATALATANERLMKAAVMAKAGTFHDPADAWSLIDRSKVKVNEETGEVEGVDKALEDLVKAKPHLVKGEQKPRGTPPRNPQKQGGKGGEEKFDERPLVSL
jgi:hypothetical protein